MDKPQMPWDKDDGNKKRAIWLKAKPWVIIISAAVLAMGLGYFGYNFWTNSGTKTTSDTTVATDVALPTPTATSTSVTSPAPSASPTPTSAPSTAPITATTTIQTTPTPAAVAPTITGIEAQDMDNNGKIDQLAISFSEKMQGVSPVTGFSVSDYAIIRKSSINITTNSQTLLIDLAEGNSYDTDATPKVTYDTLTGNVKSAAGIPLASVTLKAGADGSSLPLSAMANDTNNQSDIQTGDTVVLTFSEPVKIGKINSSNIDKILSLTSKNGKSHSWLDGNGEFGSINLSSDGKTLTIALSATGGVPSITPGDKITIYSLQLGGGTAIHFLTDLASGNDVMTTSASPLVITGSF